MQMTALDISPRKSRRKPEGNKVIHTENGFPHFSSKFPFFCMCLDSCCQRDNGCRCSRCVCHIDGIHHGEPINDPTLQHKAHHQGSILLQQEREKAKRRQIRGISGRKTTDSG